jgi:hypothetical protein
MSLVARLVFVFLCISAVAVLGEDANGQGDSNEEEAEAEGSYYDRYNEYMNSNYYQDSGMAYLYTGYKYAGCTHDHDFYLQELVVSCGEDGKVLCKEGDLANITGRCKFNPDAHKD